MAHIQEDAQRLKRLVEAVLAMVQPRPLSPGQVVVADAIEVLAARFRPWAARRGVLFEADGTGSVLADREALALVLGNLIANALAATPPGGKVTVRSRLGPDRESRWGAPGRAVWIDVTDTGPGVTAAAVEGARTGGLHIARDLVGALGGALWAEEAQTGARLVLRLPASPG
jgi:signal transduction histidine kinase